MKINYELHVLSENRTYKPLDSIGDSLKENQVNLITAGNSSGKTFILNLLSYALFLDKQKTKSLPNKIYNRISKFDNTDEFELQYEIELETSSGNPLILSKEKNGPRKAELGDRVYGHTNLGSIIEVVYDVPSDPGARITEVISSVDEWNDALNNKTKKAAGTMLSLSKMLGESKDKELIEELEQTIKDLEKKQKRNEGELKSLEELLLNCKKLNNLRDLEQIVLKTKEKRLEKNRAERELDNCPKPIKTEQRNDKRIEDLRDQNSQLLNELRLQIEKIVSELNDLSKYHHVDELGNSVEKYLPSINVADVEDPNWNESFQKFLNTTREVVVDIGNACNRILEDPAAQEIDMIKQIETVVQAGTKVRSVKSLLKEKMNLDLDVLLEHLSEVVKSAAKFTEVESIKSNVQNIPDNIGKIGRRIFQNTGEIEAEKKKSHLSGKSDFRRAERKYEDSKTAYEALDRQRRNKVSEIGDSVSINLNDIVSVQTRIKQLSRQCHGVSINDLETKFNSLKKEIEKDNRERIDKEAHLKIENAKQEVKLSETQIKKIQRLRHLSMFLNNQVADFKEPIQNYKANETIEIKDETDKSFIRIVGQIIASSLNNFIIRTGGKRQEINSFDISSDKFLCSDGTSILKSEVSTGISSATYLAQRINQSQKENLLFLFDEIGDISETSMKIVVEAVKGKVATNCMSTAILTRVNHSDESFKIQTL